MVISNNVIYLIYIFFTGYAVKATCRRISRKMGSHCPTLQRSFRYSMPTAMAQSCQSRFSKRTLDKRSMLSLGGVN